MDGFREVAAVDVGNKTERHGPLAVVLQRLVGHHRSEVGAADADVDHVANGFIGVTLPIAAAHALAEISHLVEHGVDLRHHILAINDDRCSSRRAQGDVQDRAIFCDVDFIAPKHGVDAFAQPGFLGKLQQKLEGFVRDAVLRVIQVEVSRLVPSFVRRVSGHLQRACGDGGRGHSCNELRGPSILNVQ